MNENTVYGRANVGAKPQQNSGLYGCWYGARKRLCSGATLCGGAPLTWGGRLLVEARAVHFGLGSDQEI
eukprot:1189962-Prorocentrum_minimum.AAC.6